MAGSTDESNNERGGENGGQSKAGDQVHTRAPSGPSD